jgi:translation initiation factor IF-3
MFKGREIVFVDNGRQVLDQVCKLLEDVAVVEAPAKMFGRTLTLMMAPSTKEKKQKEKKSAESEDE